MTPIKISERLPSEEESSNDIYYYHSGTSQWFPGYIRVSFLQDLSQVRSQVRIDVGHDVLVFLPLSEFSHWTFAPEKPV